LHAEEGLEKKPIDEMIGKLILAFDRQPNYREELKKMLGDAQTDNTVSFLKFTFYYNKYLNGYGISGMRHIIIL